MAARVTTFQAGVTVATGARRRHSFLVPLEDRPCPTRRGPWLGRILQLACVVQLALLAVFATTVVTGVWQLATAPIAVLIVVGAGRLMFAEFRNRRSLTSWDPFDIERHPNADRFFDGLCGRYGISDIQLVQRPAGDREGDVGIAAATRVGRTPYIILNPAALAWAGDDSLYLQKVLSHELTHLLRDHPTVRPALTRLTLMAPSTVLLAGLAAVVAAGSPSSGANVLAAVTVGFGLTITFGWRPRVFRPFTTWLRKRYEAEAERGTVGLCGPANTVLLAVQSVASDINRSIEGGFDRPAEGTYFSDADFLFEATGDPQWQDPASDAWAYIRDRFLT